MKFLIIGSKGFIGSNLASYLADRNYRVICCDVVTDYGDENYFQLDLTDPEYKEILNLMDYDVCVNCSGAAQVADSFIHNHRDFKLNSSNVYKILDSIKELQPACRFINLSSAAVYGNPSNIPVSENHSLNPISPYGEHKLIAEMILSEFERYYKLDCISLRIFSAYGSGLKKQLFWDLHQKMSKNDVSIDLFGTGQETRDFINVYDLCSAIEIVAKSENQSQVINVANGEQLSIGQVASVFAEAMNWQGEINFLGTSKKGDPKYWEADISKLKALGYKQSISLQDGLESYCAWVRQL